MRTLRAIEKSWIVAVSCLCYHIFIHKSTMMFLISKQNKQIEIQERPFQNGYAALKTANFPIPRDVVVRMSTKEAVVDDMSTKGAGLLLFPVCVIIFLFINPQ